MQPGISLGLDIVVEDKDADDSYSWVAWSRGTRKHAKAERLGDVILAGPQSRTAPDGSFDVVLPTGDYLVRHEKAETAVTLGADACESVFIEIQPSPGHTPSGPGHRLVNYGSAPRAD